MRKVIAILIAVAIMLPGKASAHAVLDIPDEALWQFDPLTVTLLILSAFLYTRGTIRLWDHAGMGKGVALWRCGCYAAGWMSLALALISPIHTLGARMFWMHMVQHEILMLIAAPLIVLSKPLLAMSWALPARWLTSIYALSIRTGARRIWRWLTQPFAAALLHAIALWGWHAPSLFAASVDHEWVHALQHLSFFSSALLFSYAIVEVKQTSIATTKAIAYLFITAIHTSILGVLLTFGSTVWYPVYGLRMLPWGMTPLEDQQLGGLIMWIPGGVVYLLGALFFGYGLLTRSTQHGIAKHVQVEV
jgi:cytochrome c oxidase assembly factor CtaG